MTILELRVCNHPGTMSHIAGLFARRAFNLEAILCVPEPQHPDWSQILLLTVDDPRLDQVERQLAKLHDVIFVRTRRDLASDFFSRLAQQFESSVSRA
jgi:acetolactate synthase I/III small subunit